jgi:hypothetical protein
MKTSMRMGTLMLMRIESFVRQSHARIFVTRLVT